MKTLITLTTILVLMGCGKDEGGSGSEAKDSSTSRTLYLGSQDDLPDCTEENQSQLVYVSEDKAFFECDKTDLEWAEVNIAGKNGIDGKEGVAGKDGLRIKARYAFFSDSYATDTNIATESHLSEVYIHAAEMVLFEDNSVFYSVTGSVIAIDTNLDVYDDTFTHSWMASQLKANKFYYVTKSVTGMANAKIQYKFSLNNGFTALYDCDGNLNNSSNYYVNLDLDNYED